MYYGNRGIKLTNLFFRLLFCSLRTANKTKSRAVTKKKKWYAKHAPGNIQRIRHPSSALFTPLVTVADIVTRTISQQWKLMDLI